MLILAIMKMEQRRPRETRFGTESKEARLAHLREQAPTLAGSRKLRIYAIFGAVLMVLTVAAFYFAMQIYKAAAEDRTEAALIEVDQAPEIVEREVDKALQRLEEEEAAEEVLYRQQLEELKAIDLLDEVEPEKPRPLSGQLGDNQQDRLDAPNE
jgi:hypothetical protein